MLKWLFFGFIGLIAVIWGGTWTLGQIFVANANKEGTFASEVYEGAVNTQLQYTCNMLLRQLPGMTEDNSEKQLKSTCNCFSQSMAKKVKQVAPGDLEGWLQKPATETAAQAVIEGCAHKAGIAYEE